MSCGILLCCKIFHLKTLWCESKCFSQNSCRAIHLQHECAEWWTILQKISLPPQGNGDIHISPLNTSKYQVKTIKQISNLGKEIALLTQKIPT